MKDTLIGYLFEGSMYLDRPLPPYSTIRIDGKIKNLFDLQQLIKVDESFDETILNKFKLNYRII